jgi:hypothetical protein
MRSLFSREEFRVTREDDRSSRAEQHERALLAAPDPEGKTDKLASVST